MLRAAPWGLRLGPPHPSDTNGTGHDIAQKSAYIKLIPTVLGRSEGFGSGMTFNYVTTQGSTYLEMLLLPVPFPFRDPRSNPSDQDPTLSLSYSSHIRLTPLFLYDLELGMSLGF